MPCWPTDQCVVSSQQGNTNLHFSSLSWLSLSIAVIITSGVGTMGAPGAPAPVKIWQPCICMACARKSYTTYRPYRQSSPVLHASELLSTDGAETYRFLLWPTNSQFAVSAFLFCGGFLEKLRRLSLVSCVSQGGGAKVH